MMGPQNKIRMMMKLVSGERKSKIEMGIYSYLCLGKVECHIPLHSNPSIKFFNWGLMSSGRTKGSLTIWIEKKENCKLRFLW